MCRRDEASVEPVWLAADRSYDALLNCTQDFALHRRRHVADFVKKKGAISSFAKRANAIGGGTGEGAFDVSKKFALQQVCGYGRAVDRDKGLRLARAVFMQRASDKFLASSRLAQNQTVASLSAARPIVFCTRRIASLER